MKKIAVVLVLVAVLAVPSAFAQLRLDMGFDIPVSMGVTFDNFSEGESMSILEFGTFPFPGAILAYQFDLGLINLGVGLKLYTLIIETIAWPMAYAELDFDRVSIMASIGGGAFIMFGIANDIRSGAIFFPDVFASVKLGKARSFRVGAGVMGLLVEELMDQEAFPYVFYLGAKWSVLFD